MEQWGIPLVHRLQVKIYKPFQRDRDEPDYVKMLETFIRKNIEGYKRPFSILSNCLLSVPYDRLSFLTWSRIWRKVAEYEAKYRSGVEKAYFRVV